MVSFTLATARSTPLPPYRLSSRSLSSRASCAPVDAPEGTMARPKAPSARVISASTVGFPRESSTSRARTLATMVITAMLARARAPFVQRELGPERVDRGLILVVDVDVCDLFVPEVIEENPREIDGATGVLESLLDQDDRVVSAAN